MEADDAALNMVYHSFGKLYKHFEFDETIQGLVKARWDFMCTESTGISYMLTPKFASDGFFVDSDRYDIFNHVRTFTEARFPGKGDTAEQELAAFVSKVTRLSPEEKEKYYKFQSKHFWDIFGRHEFPTLYLAAKVVNDMVCSSAASERVWSIFRFIHSRLRNRLLNEKVEKLAFIYINCAILDKKDKIDYITEEGTGIKGIDYYED